MNPRAERIAAGIASAMIAVGMFLMWQALTSVRVDGSRESCERQFPDKQCMIVWVPEP